MAEGQYNFTRAIRFAELIAGASLKKYVLNSEGTIFIDSAGALKINEWGAYAQLTKKLINDKLILSASGRYDKNENFKGKFTPRFTALIKPAKDHSIRLSYQTAYRFPTTQQQWIRLDVGDAVLLGGLPWILDILQPHKNPTFVFDPATGNTTPFEYKEFKPESLRSFEAGYRSFFGKKLMIDAYAYFGTYTDFTGRIILVQPTTTNKPYSIVVNSGSKVNTYGFGLGLDYNFCGNFNAFANAYTDRLNNIPSGFEAGFNTPRYRINAGIGNTGLGKNERLGFQLNTRWQESFFWEGGGFANGIVDAFTTLDAQVNYKLHGIKSMIKLGGTNILNKPYQNGFGNPTIGGMFYLSFSYNVLNEKKK
jgi:outer membrane receptor protein involved in Fe transport